MKVLNSICMSKVPHFWHLHLRYFLRARASRNSRFPPSFRPFLAIRPIITSPERHFFTRCCRWDVKPLQHTQPLGVPPYLFHQFLWFILQAGVFHRVWLLAVFCLSCGKLLRQPAPNFIPGQAIQVPLSRARAKFMRRLFTLGSCYVNDGAPSTEEALSGSNPSFRSCSSTESGTIRNNTGVTTSVTSVPKSTVVARECGHSDPRLLWTVCPEDIGVMPSPVLHHNVLSLFPLPPPLFRLLLSCLLYYPTCWTVSGLVLTCRRTVMIHLFVHLHKSCLLCFMWGILPSGECLSVCSCHVCCLFFGRGFIFTCMENHLSCIIIYSCDRECVHVYTPTVSFATCWFGCIWCCFLYLHIYICLCVRVVFMCIRMWG